MEPIGTKPKIANRRAPGSDLQIGRRPHWRFEDLEIWQLARELAVKFHRLAEKLEQRKLFRYAEQLRGAGLSMPNNIAEGSGSLHPGSLSSSSTFRIAQLLRTLQCC